MLLGWEGPLERAGIVCTALCGGLKKELWLLPVGGLLAGCEADTARVRSPSDLFALEASMAREMSEGMRWI